MNFFSFGNGCIFQDVYFPRKYRPYLQFTQLYLTEYLLKVDTVLGTWYIMMNTQNPCIRVLYRPLGETKIQDLVNEFVVLN